MTYIEFFDEIAAENVSACLTYVPDRVVYIGDRAKLMKKHIEKYKRVFDDRGYNIEFIPKTVTKNNLDSAVSILTEIVESYDDCVFDITGGDEISLLAFGMVYAAHPDKNIQMHKFNLRNNAIYDCDKDGKTIFRDTPVMSVEENIRIYGGDIAYGDIFEDKTYEWDLSRDFIKDVNTMWSFCKVNVRFWNTVIGVFEAAETVGKVTGKDTLTTSVCINTLKNYLAHHKAHYKIPNGIVKYLLKHGLLTSFDANEETLTLSYKNNQVKRCLTKAGQVLEMKIYITSKMLKNSDGSLIYNDALNGAVIDWDGEFHDESSEDVYDTENEIDILLMHNVVPVFISCKNGVVTADELYKLNTVAERFGKHYAKKILVATSIDSMGESGKYLRQRAEDMGITIIDNVHKISDSELERKLGNLWCGR